MVNQPENNAFIFDDTFCYNEISTRLKRNEMKDCFLLLCYVLAVTDINYIYKNIHMNSAGKGILCDFFILTLEQIIVLILHL